MEWVASFGLDREEYYVQKLTFLPAEGGTDMEGSSWIKWASDMECLVNGKALPL